MSDIKLTAAQQSVVALFDNGVTSIDLRTLADQLGKKVQAVASVVTSLTKKGVVSVDSNGLITRPEAGSEEVPGLDDAIAVAVARQEKGEEFVVAPSGKVAKMVRVTLDVRVSTDGRWIVARRGDKWALMFVSRDGVAQYRGEYPTCTAAFRVQDGRLSPTPEAVSA